VAKVKTHYDNLKVVRDAPPEIIRAAYKTLSQKYHPDKNPGNADAARIMAILNEAYRVLSDPDLRREHDAWIRRQEVSTESRGSTDTGTFGDVGSRSHQRQSTPHQTEPSPAPEPKYRSASTPWIVLGVVGVLLVVMTIGIAVTQERLREEERHKYSLNSPELMADSAAVDSTAKMDRILEQIAAEGYTQPSQLNFDDVPNEIDEVAERIESGAAGPKWKRPSTDPNGNQWPFVAGYLVDEPRLASDGYSVLTIDASRFDSDVHVKVVRLSGNENQTVRQIYIPAHGNFGVGNLSPGRYDVRYRDLETGHLARSDPFEVEEYRIDSGVQYSRMEMTLYKIAGGNMETHPLDEQDF